MEKELSVYDTNLNLTSSTIFIELCQSVKAAIQPEDKSPVPASADEERQAFIKHVVAQWDLWKQHALDKAKEEKEKKDDFKQAKNAKRTAEHLDAGTVSLTSFLSDSDSDSGLASCLEEGQNRGRAEMETKDKASFPAQGRKAQGKKVRRMRKSVVNKIHSKNQSLLSEISNLNSIGVAETQVHNISNIQIPSEQIEALAYGINFIPTPQPDDSVIEEAMAKFTRTVRLRWHFRFHEESEIPQWHQASSWKPPLAEPYIEKALQDLEINLSRSPPDLHSSNWTSEQQAQLNLLLSNQDILVITADKNLGYAICSVEWYQAAVQKHLSDKKMYEDVTAEFLSVDNGVTSIFCLYNRLISLAETYRHCLSDNAYAWITKSEDFKPMKFYITAKVHKKPFAGRPIAPSMNWVTFHLSEYVAKELNQYKPLLDTVLKDSTDLLNHLEEISELTRKKRPNEIWLVGLDITAMYPNLDIELGLKLMQKFLDDMNYKDSSDREFLLKSMEFILTEGYLKWENTIFRQKNGAAMGSPFAPPYADIFMYMLERVYISECKHSGKLLLYKRYLDDVFAIIHGSKQDALNFVQGLNELEPDMINLTGEIDKRIVFLDVTVMWNCRSYQFETKTFQKPMNRYPYLPWKSFHTKDMKKGFIKGEAIRYVRLSSKKRYFSNLMDLFILRLMRRGYPKSFIMKSLSSVKWEKRKLYLRYKPKEKTLPLLFPIRYDQRLNKLSVRTALNAFTDRLLRDNQTPDKLNGKVTVCYSLPPKLHKQIVKSRANKGY